MQYHVFKRTRTLAEIKMYLSHPFRKTALIIPQHVLNLIHYQLSQSVHCSEIRQLIQYCTWLERQKVFSFFKYLAFCLLVIIFPRYTYLATIWLNANLKCRCLLELWFSQFVQKSPTMWPTMSNCSGLRFSGLPKWFWGRCYLGPLGGTFDQSGGSFLAS